MPPKIEFEAPAAPPVLPPVEQTPVPGVAIATLPERYNEPASANIPNPDPVAKENAQPDYAAIADPANYAIKFDDNFIPQSTHRPWHAEFQYGHLFEKKNFRYEEVVERFGGGLIGPGEWQVVVAGHSTKGVPHEAMFGRAHGRDPFVIHWNGAGNITCGREINYLGRIVKELILCVRPVGAKIAEDRYKKGVWDKRLGQDPAGVRKHATGDQATRADGETLVGPMEYEVQDNVLPPDGSLHPRAIRSPGWASINAKQ